MASLNDASPLHVSQLPVSVSQAPTRSSLRLRVEYDSTFRGKKLKIKGKELERVPREVFNMDELEILDLSPERPACLFFRLPKLPAAIGKLRNLRILILDTNELQTLPPQICHLEHLQQLLLSNNFLKNLPDGFNNLRSLEGLHLANNRFTEFPEDICLLQKLKFLDFSSNRLQELPRNICKLRRLETLLLLYNELTELPDSIGKLSKVRTLWLGCNNLTSLPRSFAKLSNLDWDGTGSYVSAMLDGNPLQSGPPVDVYRAGMKAISNWMNSVHEDAALN